MKACRLLNTSIMRVALRYAAVYAVLMSLGLGALYWISTDFVDEQISMGLKQRSLEFLHIEQTKGRMALIHALDTQQMLDVQYPRHFLLLDSEHKKLAGDLNGWPSDLRRNGQVSNIWIEARLISNHSQASDGYWPMIATTFADGSQLLLAQSLEQSEELQEMILYTIIIILLVSIGLVLVMGWFIGKTLLMRIDHINTTAKSITSGDFAQRISLSDRNDEFDELAEQLNNMLLRIENLLTGMRQVTDNIAHDLRKPLSRLRNRLEITLLEPRDFEEYQNVLVETIEDADELIRTFNALLEIAQTEAGSFRGEWKPVDFSVLLVGLGDLYQELAASQGKHLSVTIQQNLKVMGNRHLLAQAISNLLDNAIKYSYHQGHITLVAKQQGEEVMLQVSDNGPGIPINKQSLVLERFVRLDTARSTAGSGLGLSLIKSVMALHGASLSLADNQPGLKVELLFKPLDK